MNSSTWDASKSLQRIDEAPEEIRALFIAYESSLVEKALEFAGLNRNLDHCSDKQIKEGAETARLMLEAEMRLRDKSPFSALLNKHSQ